MRSRAEAHIPRIKIRVDAVAGFDLEGTADALRELADAVERCASVEVTAGPEGRGSVAAVAGAGPLVMTHSGPHARLCGSVSSLKSLAQTLRFVAEGPRIASAVQYHAHVEYYPGHPWISEASDPLVVYLADRDDSP